MSEDKNGLRILHTSDWHLGRSLYGKKRYEAFEAFLNWLSETVEQQDIDVLLAAGDIFDTGTPSNRAQEMYYRFLCRTAASSCRHAVVIAGNHDSPTFLDAPKALLETLHVHVIGGASENAADEVLVLRNRNDVPELIVCAVPYLRDRDVRSAEAGESIEEKDRKMVDGIRAHYASVAEEAQKKRAALGVEIPIVAMGHLFAAGGRTVEGDGVRELYVGSLAHVSAEIFPSCFSYTALGHLHVPQKVGGLETVRYSGSPLPMGFGEANQKKSLCRVDIPKDAATVTTLEIPTFQKLTRIAGDWGEISMALSALKEADTGAWLEIVYEGDEVLGDLRERVAAAIADTRIEVLRIKNRRMSDRALDRTDETETLAELDVNDVFTRCLDAYGIPDADRPELISAYQTVLSSLDEEDTRAE